MTDKIPASPSLIKEFITHGPLLKTLESILVAAVAELGECTVR